MFAQMSELTLEALKSDRDYEVDPTKNTESDSIQSNMNDLITLSERFLKLFIDALPSFPPYASPNLSFLLILLLSFLLPHCSSQMLLS